MEKKKVYISIQGGVVQFCATNSDEIEVIRLDADKDSIPSLSTNIVDYVMEDDNLNKVINNNWGSVLEGNIGDTVDVEADGKYVFNDFRGTLLKIKTDTDGTMYATVEDQEGNAFDVDVLKISVAE